MAGFLAKAINRAQHIDPTNPFCEALTEYLLREGVIAWDDGRALFWVQHPQDGWQVAVWLMPAAARLEPSRAAA